MRTWGLPDTTGSPPQNSAARGYQPGWSIRSMKTSSLANGSGTSYHVGGRLPPLDRLDPFLPAGVGPAVEGRLQPLQLLTRNRPVDPDVPLLGPLPPLFLGCPCHFPSISF